MGVHFDDEPSIVDAASPEAQNCARAIKTRIATGFVPAAPEEETCVGKQIRFQSEAVVLDAASTVSAAGAKPARTRVATAFVPDANPTQDENRGVQFQDTVTIVEAASAVSAGGSKPVRSRVATGFVPADASINSVCVGINVQEDPVAERTVQFNTEHVVFDAASAIPLGDARPARTRVATGFVPSEGASEGRNSEGGNMGVHFDDEPSIVDAASPEAQDCARAIKT